MTKRNIKHQPSIAFIGTYPPRECGLATFTQDLLTSCQTLLGPNTRCLVAAMNYSASDTMEYPDEVKWEIDQDNRDDYRQVADEINENPLIAGVIVQHEYGIYGGESGENILSFLKNCKKPTIVTFHTVLPNPGEKMKTVTAKIISYASIVVVLSHNSKRILETLYPKSIGKVFVIPHGIHATVFELPDKNKKLLKLQGTILATFGLLSPSKGIEYVIKSLPKVVAKHPDVKYLILGATHPLVVRKEGETYRIELMELVKKLKLQNNVKFYDQYLTTPDLLRYLKATDIYIATSLNPDQAVSGTFSYAVGTGRAVVSTKFAQALEMITPGMGELVDIASSEGYTQALLNLLENGRKLKKIHYRAFSRTRSMLFTNTADDYLKIMSTQSEFLQKLNPILPPIKINHLRRMTDQTGLFQFSKYGIPQPEHGYTLDDNARALVAVNWLIKNGAPKTVNYLLHIYLKFIETCQQDDGTFINYIDHEGKISEQNDTEILQDAYARAMWALSETIINERLSTRMRNRAFGIWLKALPHASACTYIRSRAFLIKALCLLESKIKDEALIALINLHAQKLVESYHSHSEKRWKWFENHLSYANGILPQALILAGYITKNKIYTSIGKKSLNFLIKRTFLGDVYVPIGQSSWYQHKKRRSYFDQQPEDPSEMILALETASTVFQNMAYKHLSKKCFTWFLGNNLVGLSLYDHKNGGCYDGLQPNSVNLNQGAESQVAYLLARIAVENLPHEYTTYRNQRTISKSSSSSLQHSSLAKA